MIYEKINSGGVMQLTYLCNLNLIHCRRYTLLYEETVDTLYYMEEKLSKTTRYSLWIMYCIYNAYNQYRKTRRNNLECRQMPRCIPITLGITPNFQFPRKWEVFKKQLTQGTCVAHHSFHKKRSFLLPCIVQKS